MTIVRRLPPELLDKLLANYTNPEDLTGENGLFKQLKKALIERPLREERPSGPRDWQQPQRTSSKTILTDDGEVNIAGFDGTAPAASSLS
jgi:hypothetical protein